MKALYKIIPWFFLGLFATEILVTMLPKKDRELHTRQFGKLPVLLNGRIQPFDSVGRNALLQIRSTGDLPLEIVTSWQFWHHPKKLDSTEWLLEVFFKPEVADGRSVFLIHHPELLSGLNLTDKGIEKSGLRYYTFEELRPVLAEISSQARKASEVDQAARTTYQKQLLKLANAVMLYQRLKNSIQPEGTEDFAALLAEYQQSLPAGLAAFKAQQAGQKADEASLQALMRVAEKFNSLAELAYPLAVPPVDPEKKRDAWTNAGASLLESLRNKEIHPALGFFARMATGYRQNNAAKFNDAIAEYDNWLAPRLGQELAKGRQEFYFNRIKSFLHASIIYLFAFVLAGGTFLTFSASPGLAEALRRSAFYLITLAFLAHTFGLVFRMVLEGRPPVTNLYSSAIFIGWGACVLGLVLEKVFKMGFGNAVASLAGFVTLLIAHNLALGGDTMEMMRAVLDTNFWLATHVVVVTLGYASTFVSGALAMAYVIFGVFTKLLAARTGKASTESNLGKALTSMVYAIVCFATLFSFSGTVLGGIWADQSWGRFWGWDPKENGALLIVIWNVLILHARWGGLVRERGLMNLAIFGNMVTAFSWFGVNMLGIGLHSYGFMDAAFKWLMLFNATQIVLILLGCLPLRFWKSFRHEPGTAGAKLGAAPA